MRLQQTSRACSQGVVETIVASCGYESRSEQGMGLCGKGLLGLRPTERFPQSNKCASVGGPRRPLHSFPEVNLCPDRALKRSLVLSEDASCRHRVPAVASPAWVLLCHSLPALAPRQSRSFPLLPKLSSSRLLPSSCFVCFGISLSLYPCYIYIGCRIDYSSFNKHLCCSACSKSVFCQTHLTLELDAAQSNDR